MAAYYTPAEVTYLDRKAAERGDDPVDLVLCSDGILRTTEEKAAFEAYAARDSIHGLLSK